MRCELPRGLCQAESVPFATWEYDDAVAAFVHETTHAVARARSPLLGQIAVETSGSTASSVVASRDGTTLDLPSASVGFGLTLDLRAMREADFDALATGIDLAADELGESLVGLFVENMNKVTEFTGNVVKSNGFTFESFYEMLDKIEWSLTDEDELSMPQIVMHPDSVKELPELTPEQEQALQELHQRKHEELLAGRRRRRLS